MKDLFKSGNFYPVRFFFIKCRLLNSHEKDLLPGLPEQPRHLREEPPQRVEGEGGSAEAAVRPERGQVQEEAREVRAMGSGVEYLWTKIFYGYGVR